MKTRDLVIMAYLTAILLAGQVGLAFLANVEIVSLLVIIYTLIYKKRVFYIIYGFALVEGLIYGFGIWWLMYLYVWPALAVIVLLLNRMRSPLLWSLVSGAFGLSFGFLCALPYFFLSGWKAGLGYWIAGIPFDIIHCIGNVIITLVLFRPIYHIINKLERV